MPRRCSGEDFDYIPVTDEVPKAAEFAVHISGDSMAPYIADGSVAYVTRDPLQTGDVGIFCVDGGMFCKQYFKDAAGIVHLFSLNREWRTPMWCWLPLITGRWSASDGSSCRPCRSHITAERNRKKSLLWMLSRAGTFLLKYKGQNFRLLPEKPRLLTLVPPREPPPPPGPGTPLSCLMGVRRTVEWV